MARENNMGRRAGYSKQNYNYRMDTYIEGSAVRKQAHATAAPQRREYERAVPQRKQEEQIKPKVSRETRRNREKALQLNVGYVLFIFAISVATVFGAVHFLQLRAESTGYRKSIASLESQLSSLKMENDAAYEDAVSSVDLQEIKDIAMNKLGMVYADQGQIVMYDSQDSDYVRQYEEVPTE